MAQSGYDLLPNQFVVGDVEALLGGGGNAVVDIFPDRTVIIG